nr:hypothetical protein L203_02939 [Cryptococcus depauperatus CBS 7841]
MVLDINVYKFKQESEPLDLDVWELSVVIGLVQGCETCVERVSPQHIVLDTQHIVLDIVMPLGGIVMRLLDEHSSSRSFLIPPILFIGKWTSYTEPQTVWLLLALVQLREANQGLSKSLWQEIVMNITNN